MFCAITLSVSCRNDLLQEHNVNEQARKILTSKILHYSDLEGNPSLLRHMKKASGQSITLENGKTYTDAANGFSVEVENFQLMEDASGKKTYTFKIDRAVPTAYLENLVLYEKTADTYDAYIVEYDPEVLQNNFASYEAMKLAIKNHVRQYYLGERSLSDMNSKDTMCYVVESAWVDTGTTCIKGIHSFSDGADCIYWGTVNMATHGGYWGFTTSYVACSQMGGTTGGSPGGSTGPYGGGGSGSAANDNCKKVKKITDNTTFKNNVISLKGKTNLTNENGYRMGNPIPGTGQTGTQNQLLENHVGSSEVNLSVFSNTFALLHSHYDGLYPIFSPGDIILFNQWVNFVVANNQVPNSSIPALGDISFTVVTSNGNYMLTFDQSELVSSLPIYTDAQIDNLNEKYMEMLDSAKVNGVFDMVELEKQFLKFVEKKMNFPGMKLFKVDSNGANIEISLENGNRKTQTCP